MDIQLSHRVQRVRPSPTLAVSALAAKLKLEGRDIISLGTGEPDFDTPRHIRDAAIEAINKGFTRYTQVDGIPSLKKAIIDKLERDNGLSYAPNQILVSVGGKQSFYNLVMALLDEGDEVIIPAPYWVSYPDMVLLADGQPVIVEAEQAQGFKLTPEQLEAAITPRTKLFVLNSPSNPTGVAYTRKDLEALGEVLRRHPQVLIATDDMYEKILWAEEPFCNIVMACPDLYERTIVLNGVSKAYAMTGWRIGYAAGPVKLINAMANVQSQSTSNPTSISQVAAEAALNGGDDCIKPMIEAFKARHDFVVAALNAMPGVSCLPSQGAFYGFPDVKAVIARMGLKDDVELSNKLLYDAGVAVVPGSAFGAPGHVRLSYATSMEQLQEAMRRIARALA
ncbi:pyridoxal phosphate-dependent aminotransferase [Thiofaba sp. EF100]|uniref:pyridoxal phosphate-dependent aminotransferase n=1 Tax=Thiofaba sp. EF100 TaxID=3121274 RepID=UPI0032215160